MQIQQTQRQEGRLALFGALLADATIYVITRSVQWIEWLMLLPLLFYFRFLGNEGAFDSSPAYRAMRQLSFGIQDWLGGHAPILDELLGRHNAPGPWQTLLGLFIAAQAVAGALTALGMYRKRALGDADDAIGGDLIYWQYRLARRIRLCNLPLVMCWWMFLGSMLHRSNPDGSGWGVYWSLAAFAFVASLGNSYLYGPRATWRGAGGWLRRR